jgi:hypothetical protein
MKNNGAKKNQHCPLKLDMRKAHVTSSGVIFGPLCYAWVFIYIYTLGGAGYEACQFVLIFNAIH